MTDDVISVETFRTIHNLLGTVKGEVVNGS